MKPRTTSPAQASATPRSLGYAMPAEWEPHAATWLAWPYDPVTWPDRVRRVEEVFWQMITALAPHERVELLVKDAATEAQVRARLKTERVENVNLHRIRTADSWIRDYGPIFLRNPSGALAYTDWIFNAWGNKYETLLPDDAIPQHLAPYLRLPHFEPGMVLEGGSIEVDGQGTLLTTEQCLLNSNRNPTLTREQIEGRLRDYLGIERVLWLQEGIAGDDTDGHIDDIARFANPTTILAAYEEDPADENHPILHQNWERLQRFRDPSGRPYRVVKLPMPGRVGDEEGRLPASYANFYAANHTLLLPIFGHKNDGRAESILREHFPGRRILPIRCEDLVYGFGALHCVTQQQPHGPPTRIP